MEPEYIDVEPFPQPSSPKYFKFALRDGSDVRKYVLSQKQLEYCGFLKSIEYTLLGHEMYENEYKLIAEPAERVKVIMDYLLCGDVSNLTVELLDYFLLPYPESTGVHEEFFKIQLRELWQRRFTLDNPLVDKVLLKDVINQIPSTAPFYSDTSSLISPDRWFSINPQLLEATNNFQHLKLIIGNVDLCDFKGKLVLAGGSLLSLLLEKPVNDYDLFFVGCTPEDAMDMIKQFMSKLVSVRISFYATKRCWTIRTGGKSRTYQFVFRIYKNIDEILLGFDIDACCMVYDGKEIYLSNRCVHALKHHTNIVDFTRMSPTYEYRLYKYYKRGFDIYVPNLDMDKININKDGIPAHAKIGFSHTTGLMSIYETFPNRRRYQRRRLGYASRGTSWIVNAPKNFSRLTVDTFENVDKEDEPQDNEDVMDQPLLGERVSTLTYKRASPMLQISGLDVLLFLIFGRFSLSGLKMSDYCEYLEECKDSIKLKSISLGHGREGFRGHYVPGRWLRGSIGGFHMVPNVTFRDWCALLKAKDVMPEWMLENPGEQITSSFHAKVVTQPKMWYEGEFYGHVKQKPSGQAFYSIML